VGEQLDFVIKFGVAALTNCLGRRLLSTGAVKLNVLGQVWAQVLIGLPTFWWIAVTMPLRHGRTIQRPHPRHQISHGKRVVLFFESPEQPQANFPGLAIVALQVSFL
jgi:hypothetical protein